MLQQAVQEEKITYCSHLQKHARCDLGLYCCYSEEWLRKPWQISLIWVSYTFCVFWIYAPYAIGLYWTSVWRYESTFSIC